MNSVENMMAESSSTETNGDSFTTAKRKHRSRTKNVDCVIIGAGAAGLQCATTLLEGRRASSLVDDKTPDTSSKNEEKRKFSIVVIEARDRIGGRILTTHEKYRTVDQDYPTEVLLCRDLGASWVHGAHESNPMIQLLANDQSQPYKNMDTTTKPPLQVLNPVFEGNPWVRPHMVLHRNSKKGRNNLISFFMNGSYISDDAKEGTENDDRDKKFQEEKNVDQQVAQTSPRSSLSSRALRRHNQVLSEIVSKYNSDKDNWDNHSSVHQFYLQVNKTLKDLPESTNNNEEDEKRLVGLLSPFYLYLMENWNGISMTDIGVEQIAELIIPNLHFSDEEEKKEDGKAMSPEIDDQYTSAGDFIGPHCKVKTGMSTVLKPLIQIIERHSQCRNEDLLCLGQEVVSIIDKKSHIRIELTSGDITNAKCCVSTIPLGCLQNSISMQEESTISKKSSQPFFQPKLRDEKIEAINSIWSGSYKKVFLTFDHIFWPKQTPIIGLVRNESFKRQNVSSSDLPGSYLLLYNLWALDNNIPSIEVILCGNLGKWAFKKSDATIQQAVIKFIEAAMGLTNIHDSCTNCHVTRWEEDEYTRGSYSTFKMGTLDRHVDALRSTEWGGRLIFAGEATENEHMGSVHAALLSGNRAAEEVLDFLPQHDLQ